MELLGDMVHVESSFGLFGDSVSVDPRYVPGLRQMYHWLRKSFQTHPMVLLGDKAQVEACFSPFLGCANLDSR